MGKLLWTIAGIIFALVVIVGTGGLIMFVPLMAGSGEDAGGGDCSAVVEGDDVVKDVTAPMRKNAEAIIVTAEEEKMPEEAAVVGIMVAMQESQLGAAPGIDQPNGDGDAGVFQQRQKPGWYGTLEQVTDVGYAAKIFFKGVDITLEGLSEAEKSAAAGPEGYHIPGLTDIDGWEEMKPGTAGQKVQRSAFPDAYDKHESVARALVGGTTVECDDGGGGGGGGGGDWDDRDGKTKPGKWGGYDNGTIPLEELDGIPWAKGEYLRPDAAAGFNKLNAKFKAKFGYNIGVTDSYRTYAEQVETKKNKGNLAATPGTSNHGWAMALDLGTGINNFGTKEHKWMKDNATKFGWKHPDWAEPGGSLPEPWHWEYWGYPK